jgi:hypothetical protein
VARKSSSRKNESNKSVLFSSNNPIEWHLAAFMIAKQVTPVAHGKLLIIE